MLSWGLHACIDVGDLLQIADEWAALAKDDAVPDELDPDLQQSVNEVCPCLSDMA